jgi:hypothetical protein
MNREAVSDANETLVIDGTKPYGTVIQKSGSSLRQ